MIFNVDKFRYIAHNPIVALGLWTRMRGLIGRKFSKEMDAMVFPRCNAVHTFFMGENIDILFLDKEERVVGLYENVAPWRPIVSSRLGATTIELPMGEIAKSLTKIGDQVNLNMELTAEAIDKSKYSAILCNREVTEKQ